MAKLKAKLDDVRLEFDECLKIGHREVILIVMREPTIRDIQLVNHIEDEIENNAMLIANLTGYTQDEIMGLPVHIFQALVEGLGSFQSSKEMKS